MFKFHQHVYCLQCTLLHGQRLLAVTLGSLLHSLQVRELEERLESETLHKEIHSLKQQLELMEEDKKDLELKYQSSEEKARNLKHSGNGLESAAAGSS